MKTISRRKKIAIAVFVAVLLLLIVLFIVIGGRDQIAEITEESGSMDNTVYQRSLHRFEKGSELSLNISASKTALGEGSYQLMIVVNQEDNVDYKIAALTASLSSPSETQFLNAIVGKDGGEYGVPDVGYDGNTKIQRFGGDHYLYYSAIVTDSEPSPEMELQLRYRIEGKNRWFLNKFYNNTATLPITFPKPDEPDPPQENEETNPVTNEEEDKEVVAVAISDTSIKTIAETLADDYFVADDGIGVYYANVSDEPSWQGYPLTKGEFFGEILYSTEELELSKIEPWSANVLPIGTKLYRANEELTVVLAETDGTLIPYLKIVEG